MLKASAWFCAAALLPAAASIVRADERLQGEWTFASITVNGAALPEDDVKDGLMTVKGDKLLFKIGKDVKTFKVGKAGDLLTIVVTDEDGKKHKGIYKIEDDGKKLTMALTDGDDAPTKFEAPKPAKDGVENMLLVFKKKG